MTSRFSTTDPGFINLQSDKWELNDETDLVQLGQSTVTDIYDWKLTEWTPSTWRKFPDAENPYAKYKFISLGIQQGKNFTQIGRQTYSLLDWLGDWGGLMDALHMIAEILVAPFSVIALKAKFLAQFLRFKVPPQDSSGEGGQDHHNDQPSNLLEQKSRKAVTSSLTSATIPDGIFATLVQKYRKPREYALQERYFNRINKELDIARLVSRLRMLVLASLVTMSTPQRNLVGQMSQFVVPPP